MERSDAINELVEAMSKAQLAITPPKKTQEAKIATRTGGQYSYKYTDLAEVIEAVRKPLGDNGLVLFQVPHPTDDGSCLVETVLAHTSGQWISGLLRMSPVATDPQAYGSCLTYNRRYSALMILGLAPEDDDAEASMERPPQRKPPSAPEKPVAVPKPVEPKSDTPRSMESLRSSIKGLIAQLGWAKEEYDKRRGEKLPGLTGILIDKMDRRQLEVLDEWLYWEV